MSRVQFFRSLTLTDDRLEAPWAIGSVWYLHENNDWCPFGGLQVKSVVAPLTHCSKLEIVLNENDTPQNQQFLLVYTLVLPKESRLQKSVDIQG